MKFDLALYIYIGISIIFNILNYFWQFSIVFDIYIKPVRTNIELCANKWRFLDISDHYISCAIELLIWVLFPPVLFPLGIFSRSRKNKYV